MSQYPKDIVTSSQKVKEAFVQRCSDLEVLPEAVCHHAGIPIEDYKKWQDAQDGEIPLSQGDVITLLKTVYIHPQVTLVITPEDSLKKDQRTTLRNIALAYSS